MKDFGKLQDHGTRARYVRGCRCAACREANRLAYHARQAKAKAAAAELAVRSREPIEKTPPGGTPQTRTYRTRCPGLPGERCPKRSHIRRDSIGGVCAVCRSRLVWNGLVDARAARRHLRRLSRAGVGYKQVADAALVSPTIVGKILRGERKRIRKATSDRILEVDAGARADGALVDAAETWRMLRELEAEYFSKAELARQLGYRAPALQVGKRRVRASTEARVRRLYRRAKGLRS